MAAQEGQDPNNKIIPAGEAERTTRADADRAYHLDRVARKFKYVISQEKAELLLGLLGP
jgi:hypothetical protein